MKKVLMMCFLIVIAFVLVGCQDPIKTYEDEYFIYKRQVYMDDHLIYLSNLTEKGKAQEVLFIPGNFNGYEVRLSSISIITTGIHIESDNLKKVYIDKSISSYSNIRFSSTDGGTFSVKIIILNSIEEKPYPNGTVYISSKKFNIEESKNAFHHLNPANVSYYYNYESSPNDGYYWLDDYDNELITYIPSDPIRSGYQFGGWYKEAECINKWDFEKDIIPAKEYDYKENNIYKETILYAKWIEK